MSLVLQVKLKNMEGVLERVLGVVRYRGYHLLRLMAHPTPDGSGMDLTLKVNHPSGSVHLPYYLTKLFDVEAVETYRELARRRFG